MKGKHTLYYELYLNEGNHIYDLPECSAGCVASGVGLLPLCPAARGVRPPVIEPRLI